MSKKQERTIELQRQLKIARYALERIRSGCRDPECVANSAIYDMMPLDLKVQLQGIVGHMPRACD